MTREFTGRHMSVILIAGFGIVMAVNFTMATLAMRGFGGVVVDNSYVASQKFNGWLETARAQDALSWEVAVVRAGDGRMVVTTAGVPAGARVSAALRRPLGDPAAFDIAFAGAGPGAFVSTRPVPPGRWIARVSVFAGGEEWTREMRFE
ncbi:FixH family protein [uncultured Croceicoccus sp.]|uniref:FixH family protein n=1 Tax=uncultured Croceicoccus sp. TaxID=1295329 RepID=UPI0026307760|nr:FixH family protein [uncultured Croceicoccus sp.]